jgi:hypothetical protein
MHGENGSGNSNNGLAWLFGQMFILPFRTFLYGMERLLETMRDMQHAGDRGMEVIAGGGTPSGAGAQGDTPPAAAPSSYTMEAGVAGPTPEIQETRTMDKDLNDDTLKLVRFKILFVKRDYEHAFPEQEELVSDNIDGTAFTAWKIAEFIQRCHRDEIDVPYKWRNKYPKEKGKEYLRPADAEANARQCLLGFPEEDKKYLRVYYEVLERYKREKFRYEEDQIDVLREIRDAIAEKPKAGD